MARLVVKHNDFTLEFHCRKLANVLKKSEHNNLTIKGGELYSHYSWSSDIESIKIEQDIGEEEIDAAIISEAGHEEVEKGAPFFFDNTVYNVNLKMADHCSNPKQDSRFANFDEYFHSESDRLSGILQFHNDVGKSDFKFQYFCGSQRREFKITFHVLSSKLDYHKDWKGIVEDIEDEYRMLSYDFLKKTYHSFSQDEDGETSDMIWWNLFEKHRVEFVKACRLVLSRPRLRHKTVNEYKRADQLKVLTPSLENDVIRFRDVPSHLYRDGRGVQTKDTPENRFFKYVVHTISEKHDRLAKRVHYEASRVGEDSESVDTKKKKLKKLSEEVEATSNELRQIKNNPFFRGVGRFEGLRQVSLVLQRASGYAAMMRIYGILNALYDLQDGLYGLETKNIADLYELWCFIEVKNQVAAALGVDKKEIKHTNRTEMGNWFGEDPKKGKQSCVVIESKDKRVRLEVLYNAATVFSGKSGIEQTVAPTGGEQKPDIVMRLVREFGSEKAFKLTYIFDAKYRLDDESAISGVGAPPSDAINQMHRYRDAIYYGEIKRGEGENQDIKKEIIGGYVLFPGSGTEEQVRATTLYKSIDKVNIGALPLRPGYEVGRKFLCDFIKGLINKSTEEQLVGMKSQALKGTMQEIDGKSSGVESVVGMLKGASIIDHLGKSKIDLLKKRNFYIKGKQSKPIDPKKVEWVLIFDGGSGELSMVAKLEYVRTVTGLEELKTHNEDGLDYPKADKSDFVGASEYYVWRIL